MPITTEVNLLKIRRTKIIATLGPASADPDTIRALLEAGVNVLRLNMSHGDHDFHRNCLQQVRDISRSLDRNAAVMADLCGPKIRIGKLTDGSAQLCSGEQTTLSSDVAPGNAQRIPSQYQNLASDVTPGDRILLGDGSVELSVQEIVDGQVHCQIQHGGVIKDHAGMYLAGVKISAPTLSEKDRQDAQFAVAIGVDYLALSFVRQAADIEALRSAIETQGKNIEIIAKIEKPEALQHINSILGTADGIMVARGDLGIELDPEQVPVAQQQLIDRARRKCKPVIVATQMLESMIESPKPTRAEVSDVANAVYAGADAVMLSGETAIGAFPVATVQMMARIAGHIESEMWQRGHGDLLSGDDPEVPIWLAVADTVSKLSRSLRARAVIVHSRSGASVKAMSAARPHAPIIAVSNDPEVCRRMHLLWGVIPIQCEESRTREPVPLARQLARERGLAEPGQPVLLVQGFHQLPRHNTPSLTVVSV